MKNYTEDEKRWIESKVPKLKSLINTSSAAKAFYSLLMTGADPFRVIDEMISYYEPVVENQREQVNHLIAGKPPQYTIVIDNSESARDLLKDLLKNSP